MKIGQIVRCIEKPEYLSGFSRGKQYVVNRTSRAHGALYVTILGDDNQGHSLLASMFIPAQRETER